MKLEEKKKDALIGIILGVLIGIPLVSITNSLSDDGIIDVENYYISSGSVVRFIDTKILAMDFVIANGSEIRILLDSRDGEKYNYADVEKLEDRMACINYVEKIYSSGRVKYSLKSINEGSCNHE